MIWRKDVSTQERTGEATRRDAIRLGGGAALAVLAMAGLGGGAGAQVASPAASPAAGAGLAGRYIVVRIRKVKLDHSPDELLALIQEGFVPLIEQVPGFVSYVAVADPETRAQFTISIFEDKAGAEKSTSVAADWGTGPASDYVEGDPVVVQGVITVTGGLAAKL